MRLSLEEHEVPSDVAHRTIEPSDAAALGALLLAAYRGTVDDEGETLDDAVAEVEGVLGGSNGPFLFDASFVVEDEDGPIGASLIAMWESRPLLSYLVVHPRARRRGLGSFLIARSGDALLAAGHPELDLFVTEANEPAVNLYRKLAFRVVDRVEGPAAGA